MPSSRRPLLVVLPFLPSDERGDLRKFLRLLGQDFDAHAFIADSAPDERSQLDALGRALEQRRYEALIAVDGPRPRELLHRLRARAAVPTVLAQFPGEPRAQAALRNFPACHPDEVWRFSKHPPRHGTEGLLPRAFHLCPSLDRAWLRRRVREAGGGAPSGSRTRVASVIIACWNNLRYTRECVSAVQRRTKTPYELVLVDNGSTDGTARYLRGLKARVITNASNLGFAQAINQGMKAAKGDYLVWLNNDAVPTTGWLERLVSCAERAPWIGAVGPLTNECEGIQRLADAGALKPRQVEPFAQALAMAYPGRCSLVHRLIGFCFLVKREAAARIGPLDERFGAGCYEDFDYCLRLRQAGYELALAEDTFVYHYGHQSFKDLESLSRQAGMNRQIFVDKWCRRSLEFLDDMDPLLAQKRA